MAEWLPLLTGVVAVAISFAGFLLSRHDKRQSEATLRGILEERDKQRDRELTELRRRFDDTQSHVLAERMRTAENFIVELRDMKHVKVDPYIPRAIDALRDRVEHLYVEIGSHDTGIKGRLHRVENVSHTLSMTVGTVERMLDIDRSRK